MSIKKHWLAAAILSAYVVIASIRLRLPGPHYDETLFLNGALGGVDTSTFITKTFHGLPVLLMPYIGALKSWIFFPIFKIFGVSAVSMRFPAIILTAVGLWLLYKMVADRFGRLLASAILACTALSASFIIFTRLDFGPVVLDFLIKIMGLVVLLAFLDKRRMRYLVFFWTLMLLGTFNKLNFIWYVNAFLGAFVIVYGLGIWQKSSAQLRWRYILISAAGFLACVGYYLHISAEYHLHGGFGFIGFQYLYHTLSMVIDGAWFYNYAFSNSLLGTTIVFWLMLGTMVVGSVLTLNKLRTHKTLTKQDRFFCFTAAALVLLIAELAVTLQATAGWHYFSVYPLWNIMFVLSLATIASALFRSQKSRQRNVIILVVAVSCLYQLICYSRYISVYNKPALNPGWSASMYQLIDFTKSHKNPVVSLDWGFQTQLIGFDGVPNKYYEVFGPVATQGPEQEENFQKYIATKPNAFYVTHGQSALIFPKNTPDFFTLSSHYGLKPVLVKTIYDNGTPLYKIYQLKQQ